jgi:hypothetical protein
MNTIETPITKEKVAALVADAFQDSEYFLPKIALQDQLGLNVEVISLKLRRSCATLTSRKSFLRTTS